MRFETKDFTVSQKQLIKYLELRIREWFRLQVFPVLVLSMCAAEPPGLGGEARLGSCSELT